MRELLGAVLGSALATVSLTVLLAPAAGAAEVPEIVPGSIAMPEFSARAALPVTLSAPSDQPVTVRWGTENYQATAPQDFNPQSGTLTFEPGTTSSDISVSFKDDLVQELDEALVVRFTDPTNATVGGFGGIGAVVIRNDDPTIEAGTARITEGDAGTKVALVPVALSAAASRTVTADWETVNDVFWPGNLPGASAPEDFVAASGTITFAPGQTQQTVAVTIKGDTRFESDERVGVRFSNARDAGVRAFFGEGIVTIVNDDPGLPTIVPGTSELFERERVAIMDVALSAPSEHTVTARWETVSFSAKTPGDYTAASGTITFARRMVEARLEVSIRNDRVEEPDEILFVRFSSPTNATVGAFGDVGPITIRNDDPTIVAGRTSITEGDQGTKVVRIPVTLSWPSVRTISASWRTRNDLGFGGVPAQAPGDFVAASGTVRFAPGETTKTVSVLVKGDALDEPNENLVVELFNPVNAPGGIGGFGLGVAEIVDDD